MSAPDLRIAHPNTLTGSTDGISRLATLTAVRREDKVRRFWIKTILPTVTKDEFLQDLVKSDHLLKVFKLDNSDGDMDAQFSELSHVAAFQNLAQLADKNVPLAYIPWQVRIEFAPQLLPRINTVHEGLVDEMVKLFKDAGWKFWRTETGFVIAPLTMFENLRSLSFTYMAWINMRDFRGAGFTDFCVEDNDEDETEAIWKHNELMAQMPALEEPGIDDKKTHFKKEPFTPVEGDTLNKSGRVTPMFGVSNALKGLVA